MKNLLIIIACSMILAGCASAPPSAANLYGPNPVSQKIPGSNAQGSAFRGVEFTSEEVYEATKSAMLRLGYNKEYENPEKTMLAASGYYDCGGSLKPPVTMAVYIEPIDARPTTKVTVIVDRHDYQCWGSGEVKAANQLVTEIQKVLSTY